jgi:WW domain-containing oxidoreductase
MTAEWRFGARSTADDVLAGKDLAGRTIIVTGANSGIGFETARAVAAAGARTIFACRSQRDGDAAVERARATHTNSGAEARVLDLASFASIGRFCATLEAPRIDGLVCNAGLTISSWAETEEGFERTVGVCHIGHFLLTRLLMPRLLASGTPRVVIVASESHRMPARLAFDRLPQARENFGGLVAYGQAKLCNVLMAKSLQRRYGAQGLTACSPHPGTLVTTRIGRNSAVVGLLVKLVSPFTKTPAQGAATSVVGLVHEPATEVAGQYLMQCRPAPSSTESNDPAVADRLWAKSEEWIARANAPAWPQ